jgi:hypothetical protein
VGGELAERGPSVAEPAFLLRAREELAACLPGVDLSCAQWSSYLVQRAEPRTAGGRRPPSAHVRAHGAVVSVWPVKLVMAPRAAAEAIALAAPRASADAAWPAGTESPSLAPRPWETATWSRLA